MFSATKRIDRLVDKSRLLMVFVMILALINIYLVTTIKQLPKNYEFYISRQAYSQGGKVKPDDIPVEHIYTFASTFIPYLHSWVAKDKNIRQKRNKFNIYFSPRHRAELRDAFDAYEKLGFFNRTQTATLYRAIEPGDIKQVSRDLWVVSLVLRVTQKLNDNDDTLISDKTIQYQVRVARSNLPLTMNNMGLMLDGYQEKEITIENKLSEISNEKI